MNPRLLASVIPSAPVLWPRAATVGSAGRVKALAAASAAGEARMLTTMLSLLSIIAATLAAMIPFTHIAGRFPSSGQPGPNRYGAQPSKVLP